MSAWQLVVHQDEDSRTALRVKVCAAVKEAKAKGTNIAMNVVTAGNIEHALQILENDGTHAGDCVLLVIGSNVPAGPKDSLGGATAEPAIHFVEKIRKLQPALPVVILAKLKDPAIDAFARGLGSKASLVQEGADCFEHVALHAASQLRELPMKEFLEVDITMDDKSAQWNWSMRQRGRLTNRSDDYIVIDSDKLDKIVDDSERLSTLGGDKWNKELNRIAGNLNELLFDNHIKNRLFWAQYVNWRAECGGLSCTRVRFNVNENSKPLLLEAIKGLGDKNFWALEAPIFRRYQRSGNRLPLFKDRSSRQGPINCLLIAADPDPGNISSAGVPDASGELWEGKLAQLGHAVAEVREIAGILRQGGAPDEYQVKELYLGDEKDPRAALEKALKQEWHLVHFAGHGVVGQNGTAGLVLSAEAGGVMPVADLVRPLRNTQFFFVSSCRSAGSGFVVPALEAFIPAVTGFRWSVNDASASKFAVDFYQELFDKSKLSYKYLEYAFLNARRKRHELVSGDPVWMNAVLVMQLIEAEGDLVSA